MATVKGADVAIMADLDAVPFVLDIHHLDHADSLLTPTADALADVSCLVTRAAWRWGAETWRGALTTVDAGTAELLLADPDRRYDPANVDVPRPVPLGSPIQVLVDGASAWYGYITQVSHDYASGLTTVQAVDAVAILAQIAYDGLTSAGTTWAVLGQILDRVGWPAALRATYGAPAAYRSAGLDPEQGWPAVIRNALAEGAQVWVDRSGKVVQAARGWTADVPEAPPVIGCDGADISQLESGVSRDMVRNDVQVDADETFPTVRWSDPTSVAAYGRRTLRVKRDELRLALAP